MSDNSDSTRPGIRVAALPDRLEPVTAEAIVVVIDTLRFTTCVCTALAHGASAVYVASSVAEAKRRRDALEGDLLLCGERACKPIPGFDLGNSPAEYDSDRVAGRTLVFTTTNGTRAVAAAGRAGTVVLGSLLNRAAIARYLRAAVGNAARPGGVWILCAGTDGRVAGEDLLTAGAIMAAGDFAATDPVGRSALDLWWGLHPDRRAGQPPSVDRAAIAAFFRETDGGKNLIAAGYEDDLAAAAQIDALTVVPRQVLPGRVFRPAERCALE